MIREIVITADGSHSIHLPEWDESYHSKHGAVQEAKHVFIKNGLDCFLNKEKLSILEIGFGTGLNAYITLLESIKRKMIIDYCGIEAYPLTLSEVLSLNYSEVLDENHFMELYEEMHKKEWGKSFPLNETFELIKQQMFFQDINYKEQFDLIYFDAFGYRVQPELWSVEIFKKMYDALLPKGILVTYAARTVIKKALIEVGFSVEILPGPPGKREMTRATKL